MSYLLELLDAELRVVLALGRLHVEADRADLGALLHELPAHPAGRYADAERLGDLALDVDQVIADLLLLVRQLLALAVFPDRRLDLFHLLERLLAGLARRHLRHDVTDDLQADWGAGGARGAGGGAGKGRGGG